MPRLFFPRGASISPCRDGFAIRLIDDVNLVMGLIGFFSKMDVVKLLVGLSSEGDAQVIVAIIERAELAFHSERKIFPLRAFIPQQIPWAANGGCVLVLSD